MRVYIGNRYILFYLFYLRGGENSAQRLPALSARPPFCAPLPPRPPCRRPAPFPVPRSPARCPDVGGTAPAAEPQRRSPPPSLSLLSPLLSAPLLSLRRRRCGSAPAAAAVRGQREPAAGPAATPNRLTARPGLGGFATAGGGSSA